MNKQTEALMRSLEALDHSMVFTSLMPGYDGLVIDKAYKAIREALAEQPAQQEPVKWSDYEPNGTHHNKPQKRPQNCGTGYCSCIECVMEPAQRTWVGLTDEEFEDIELGCRSTPFGKIEAMKKVEAKLKEKNT